LTESRHEHPWWRTADVVFGGSALLALILDYFWPLSFQTLGLGSGDSFWQHVLAVTLLLSGGAVIFLSKRALRRAGETSAPDVATQRIVKHGMYRYSRNPLYLGLLLCYVGLGFGIDLPWLLILALPTMILTHWLLIRPEERYLLQRFGREFVQYKETVRRWL